MDDLEQYREVARGLIGTSACAAIIGLITQVEHDRKRIESTENEAEKYANRAGERLRRIEYLEEVILDQDDWDYITPTLDREAHEIRESRNGKS